ncbi:hypothetical protein [Streptomyces tubercidicus]|uniref:Uncharacterized protein n=1 Tax=Streptomyces tubercidicus TaxID=47759 RepID=A0A640UIR8_9ACTN|nr:hypothetical protein [Streptomyces tubercidicus]WAU10574.1 hypothetical protein STRTU_000670 [Streptomyces tubercidicus]GFE35687.1 hypothetical protein Stube_03600 [Streptomyces tubercidicus]
MTSTNDDLVIRLVARAEFEKVYLRVSPMISKEAMEVLRDVGAEAGEIQEFGLEPVHVVIGVTAGPGVWLNLRVAINALGARRKEKTFRLELSGEESIEANGHSAKDTERLLKASMELYAQRAALDEAWRRRARGEE